jgi:prepilin-type N-terminal cleavage/methylation domain-containing protein
MQRQQRGFTLVEALVAMVVMAFGMLAIAGFQATLGRNSELSRQRAEATRLAQESIEQLRSFQDLTGYNAIATTGASAVTTLASNTSFQRGWTVADIGTGKWVNVTVTWADRDSTNPSHSVVLSTVISRSDPSDIGANLTGMSSLKYRLPKDRSPQVPFPAKDLGNGYSAYKPGASWSQAFVFDNVSGLARVCPAPVGTVTDALTNTIVAGCSGDSGYVLAGFIRTPAASLDDPLATSNINGVRFLNLTYRNGTNVPSIDANSSSTAPTCLLTPRTDSVAPHPDLSATDVTAYLCLIVPTDTTTTPPSVWGGRVDLIGDTMPNGTSICRFTADYNGNGTRDNEEHPQTYTNVGKTLQNQNFATVSKTTCPSNMANNSNTTTRPLYAVKHQACSPAGVCTSVDNPP